jgi:hypothetical protein
MSDATNRRIATYRDFWPHYLQEHSRPETRAIHYLGSALSVGFLLAFLFSGNSWFILGALLGGYGPAWIGHFFIEHNRPATFTYPLWSLFSDYRMTGLWISGRIDGALKHAGVTQRHSR